MISRVQNGADTEQNRLLHRQKRNHDLADEALETWGEAHG